MKNRIVLITGPKHSGKTLCARALKNILGCEAVDLDEVVEKQTGQTPRELFKKGPEVFRKAEALALASLTQPGAVNGTLVVAAGGGLTDNGEAMTLLSRDKEIVTVYLEVPPETAWQRILDTAAGGELPPFLNTEDPKATHLDLHTRRAKACKALAQITIQAENKSPEDIAREIAHDLVNQ